MHCTGFHIDRTAWRALWAIRWSAACGVEANMAGQAPFPRTLKLRDKGCPAVLAGVQILQLFLHNTVAVAVAAAHASASQSNF